MVDLAEDARVTIVPADTATFDQGVQLFLTRADKNWSLTDCLSFVVMNEAGLKEAFTEDLHFEQAGYIALLRER